MDAAAAADVGNVDDAEVEDDGRWRRGAVEGNWKGVLVSRCRVPGSCC